MPDTEEEDATHPELSSSSPPPPPPPSPTPRLAFSSPPPPPPSPQLPCSSLNLQEGSRHSGRAPVDHGWAWVVLFSSFFISAVVDGVGLSVGVLFTSLQKVFNINNQQVSWVSSVLNGTYLLIGPLVSFCIHRHGCRKAALLGSVMAAVSFILSTLSSSITLVIVVYGLFGGIGLGFLYQPSVVIVGHYFHTRRALALGIMACGSGIGAFAFAPLFSIFVERYNWKGATYLTAALVLLCIFACVTFKPLVMIESSPKNNAVTSKSITFSNKESKEQREQDQKGKDISEMPEKNMTERYSAGEANIEYVKNNLTLRDLSNTSPCLDELQMGKTLQTFHATDIKKTISKSVNNIDTIISSSLKNREKNISKSVNDIDKNISSSAKNYLQTEDHTNRLLDQESVLSTGQNEKATEKGRTSMDMSEAPKSSRSYSPSYFHGVSDAAISVCSEQAQSQCHRCWHHFVWLPIKENICLMKRPSVIVYGIACFLMSVGMYVPTTFLPLLAQQLGFKASEGAFLVSAVGIGNVIGRFLTGLIAHYYPKLVMALNHGCLFLAGLSTCFLPALANYYLIMGYSLLVGACIGMFVVLQVMVLIELLGFDHLTNAFGVVNVYHGIGTFAGPPMAGFIADTTGSLGSSFYAIGVAFTLAGLICLPLHRTSIAECRSVKASSRNMDLRKPYMFCWEKEEGKGSCRREREREKKRVLA